MAIPLKELFIQNSIQLNELITLNIMVNAMERPSLNNGNNEGASPSGAIAGMGGGRGGRGGMGGGMSRGGMSRGGSSREYNSGDRSSMFEQASFKQKFTLVQN